MERYLHVNLTATWEYGIDDAIDSLRDYLDFSSMPEEELKKECMDEITTQYDDEMLSSPLDVNYTDIVYDVARWYGLLPADENRGMGVEE